MCLRSLTQCNGESKLELDAFQIETVWKINRCRSFMYIPYFLFFLHVFLAKFVLKLPEVKSTSHLISLIAPDIIEVAESFPTCHLFYLQRNQCYNLFHSEYKANN